MKNYPFNTLRDLKKMVGKKEYAEKAKGSEEETQINARAKTEAAARKIISARLAFFAKNKKAMNDILAADKTAISAVAASAGDYKAVEKATTMFLTQYIEATVADKARAQKLVKNKKVIEALTDMIHSECGAEDNTIESVIAGFK
jgi:epoxyqueuosine reductase QueG